MLIEINSGNIKIAGFEAFTAQDAVVILRSLKGSYDSISVTVISKVRECIVGTLETNDNWEVELVKTFELAAMKEKIFWVALDASGRINEVTEFKPVENVNSNNFKWQRAITGH